MPLCLNSRRCLNLVDGKFHHKSILEIDIQNRYRVQSRRLGDIFCDSAPELGYYLQLQLLYQQ